MNSPYLNNLLDKGRYDDLVYNYVTHNPTIKISASKILSDLGKRYMKGSEIAIYKIHKSLERLRSKGVVRTVGNRSYQYITGGN